MIKIRRRLAALVILLLILVTPTEAFASSEPASAKPADSISSWDESNPGSLRDSNLYGQSAILIDARTGETLYAKSPDRLMYPASTTKILTALIALEKGDFSDMITASRKAAATEATYIPVKEGEKFSLKDLLYTLMLISANDSAVAIAEHYGGSTDGFAEMMNQRAKALGCTDSNFVTPNGLPDPNNNHYSTVADMAKIARAAMQNETFREIVSAPSYTLGPTNKTDSSRKQINKNKMLPTSGDMFAYQWCIGGKTGYTKASQHTYVAAANKDGVSLICVIFGTTSDGKWLDAKKLFEYGFSKYSAIDIPALYAASPTSCEIDNSDDGDSGILRLDIANPEALAGVIGEKSVIKRIEENFLEYVSVYYPEIVEAPIAAGQKIAELSIRLSEDGEPVRADLVASRKVEARPVASELSPDINASLSADGVPPTFEQIAQNASNSPVRYMAYLLLLPVVLLVGLVISMAMEMHRRRRRRNRPRGSFSPGDTPAPLRRRY